jgi:hypothetical protein
MRRGILLITTLVAILFTGLSANAAGVTCPPGSSPSGGKCIVDVTPPGGGGGGGGSEEVDNPGSGGGGTRECRQPSGEVVPCQTELGYWSGTCYEKDVSSEYPPSDPIWGGRTEGVILRCTPINGASVVTRWEASAPGVTGPSARELADRAVAAMDFRAGAIGITPPPGPDKMGIVGVPTWLWVADPGESTTGPITRSASGGGITVTATGRLDRIVYNMGDGKTVTCTGAGTPYQESYGGQSSPTCGYLYTKTSAGKPGEKYTVSATSHWTVSWSGGGQTGTIPLTFTRDTQISIGELQVIVTR